MLAQAHTSKPPTADEIRQAAGEVISRPYFDLNAESPLDSSPAILLELLRWIIEPFRWLFDSLEGLPDAVRWVIVILAALICLALIAHIIYTVISAIRGPIARQANAYKSTGRQLDPARLEQDAARASAGGEYVDAIRFLFRAALLRLELAEKRSFQPGFTNRELLRRYQATPLHEPIRRFVELIDQKWYGGAACEPADYAACQYEHERIRRYIEGSRLAVGA